MMKLEQITVAVPAKMASTIRHAVESGDYASNSEVFYDALLDWQRKRQVQLQEIKHIKANVQRGLADLRAGHIKPAEEVLTRLDKKYQAAL